MLIKEFTLLLKGRQKNKYKLCIKLYQKFTIYIFFSFLQKIKR